MANEIHEGIIKVRPIFKRGPEIGPVDVSATTEQERLALVAHYQGVVAMTGSTTAQEQLARLQSADGE